MKVGTLFGRIFFEQLTSDIQKKSVKYSDKKSDLIIKQREDLKNIIEAYAWLQKNYQL